MRATFYNLQAMRGVACLLVVVYHVATAESGLGLIFSPLRPFLWFGFAGVDLFFVLSGFIIATTNRDRSVTPGAVAGFLFRRAWRVYPTYWVALVAGTACFAGMNAGGLTGVSGGEIVDHLLLLPTTDGPPRLLPVAWSLSYEVMFYLAFAGLMSAPRRLGNVGLVVWAGVVCGGAVIGWVAYDRFTRQAVSPFVLEFLAGVLVAHLPAKLTSRSTWGLALLAGVWAGLGLWLLAGTNADFLATTTRLRVVVFGVSAAVVVFAAAGRERAGGRVRSRWLLAAGDASYSIYLVHTLGITLVLSASITLGVSHTRVPHVAWIGASLVAAIAAGAVLHVAVERPLMRMAKARPKAVPVAVPTTSVPARKAA